MLSNLTGIRGLAALWVFGLHYNEYFVGLFPGISILNFVFDNGGFGVDLFFCLSGFILGHVYFEELNFEDKGIRVKHYLYKRFARLYPLYFVTLTVASIFYLIALLTGHEFHNQSSTDLSLAAFIQNLLGVQTWFGMNSLNVPAWSVSAEFAAYLAFPFLVLLLRRRDKGLKSLSFMLLILSTCIYEFSLQQEMLLNHQILQVLTQFIMGLCVYRLVKDLKVAERKCKLLRNFVTSVILLSLFFVESKIVLSAVIPILLLILISLNYFHNIPGKGLSRKSLLALGSWSYSLYMTHALLKNILSGLGLPYYDANLGTKCFELILLLTVPIFTAFIATKYLENPARRYLLKLWV
jgi:peptidoglycan/LPS O-acetylase OafA/YrhL